LFRLLKEFQLQETIDLSHHTGNTGNGGMEQVHEEEDD
jgi:hypothetical protein